MGIINLINDLLWTYILVALLLGCAVWFTLRTRFVQFRMIKEIQRPSSAKLWQMPQPPTVFPSMPALPERTVPLEEQETSYFADSASIFSLLRTFSSIIPASKVAIILFKNKKDRQ